MPERPAAAGLPAPLSARLPGLDALKGLCIAGVVLIHAAPSHEGPYAVHFVDGVARLAVPLFLTITGYLAGMKGTGRARFRANLVTFAVLHLIYGAFYGLLNALLHGLPEPLTAKFVVMRFAESAYPGQYYLVILIQLFLFTSLLPDRRSWRSAGWLWASAVAAAAGVALLTALPILARELDLPALIVKAARTPNALWLWFFYFALGARLGAAAGEPTWSRLRLAGAALGLVVATLGVPDLPVWDEPLRYPYARAPIYLGATLVALALPVLARVRGPALLARLGRDSFGIYVLNPAVLAAIAALFGPRVSLPVSWLQAAATLAVCTLMTVALRRWAPWALP